MNLQPENLMQNHKSAYSHNNPNVLNNRGSNMARLWMEVSTGSSAGLLRLAYDVLTFILY